MNKAIFYKTCCILMACLTLICLAATLVYVFTATNAFDTALPTYLLIIMGATLLICLLIGNVNGNKLYKLGFYILHMGLVIMIIGFVIYAFWGKSYNVSVYKDGKFYNSVKDGNEIKNLGFYFRLDGTENEYYESEGNESRRIKQYYAYLTFQDGDGSIQTSTVSVNNPIYKNEYKIYLMSVSGNGDIAATLLIKSDPSENTVYMGIVLLIIGSFVMCFQGTAGKKKEAVTK